MDVGGLWPSFLGACFSCGRLFFFTLVCVCLVAMCFGLCVIFGLPLISCWFRLPTTSTPPIQLPKRRSDSASPTFSVSHLDHLQPSDG